MKDTTARVRLRLDHAIAEIGKNGGDGQLHLLSVIGGDSDISAVWAAAHQDQIFKVEGPGFAPVALRLGEKAECYRGSLNIPSRRRAVRHLVAVSAEMAQTRLGAGAGSHRTILSYDDPAFILYRLSERFGLPVVPEWAEWFTRELKRRRAITPLAGIGCSPVLITGGKTGFLSWFSRGLRRGLIGFPQNNGPICWPAMPTFLHRRAAPASNTGVPVNGSS
ncbi:MAG TPA: hypothetical protein VFZ08_04480 [Terriglobia bacterium]|nr:hypothetical protein [Terriglobia bacterium]